VQVTKLKILLNPFAKGFRDNDDDTDWCIYAVPTAATPHRLQTLPFSVNMTHSRPVGTHEHL
jgi:hypothetical protein